MHQSALPTLARDWLCTNAVSKVHVRSEGTLHLQVSLRPAIRQPVLVTLPQLIVPLLDEASQHVFPPLQRRILTVQQTGPFLSSQAGQPTAASPCGFWRGTGQLQLVGWRHSCMAHFDKHTSRAVCSVHLHQAFSACSHHLRFAASSFCLVPATLPQSQASKLLNTPH